MRRVRYFAGYSRPRLYFVVGLFGLSFLAILVRLTVVQVGQYTYWRNSAEAQYGRRITVSPVRGSIYDRHNNVLAASISGPPFTRRRAKSNSLVSRHGRLPRYSLPSPKAALSSDSPPRLTLSG